MIVDQNEEVRDDNKMNHRGLLESEHYGKIFLFLESPLQDFPLRSSGALKTGGQWGKSRGYIVEIPESLMRAGEMGLSLYLCGKVVRGGISVSSGLSAYPCDTKIDSQTDPRTTKRPT